MQRYDYIQRAIEQLGQALGRIAGLKAQGQIVEALAAVHEAYSGLDLNPYLVRSLDGASLARLLGEPAKRLAVAQLLKEEADLREELGEPGVAYAQRRRALELCATVEAGNDEIRAQLVQALETALASRPG